MGDKQNLAKESQLALKQDKLIAGANITIALDGKTISAANPTSVTVTPVYQAGTLVAAIIVNGNTTNIYAPAQHGDNANQNLAVPFSAAQTYEEGDFVIYQENLYKCTTAIDTPAAWDSTKWMRVLITDEMGQGGDNANQNIANTYDITSTYDVGDYVIYDGLLYKCITAVETPGSFDINYWTQTVIVDEMGSGSGDTSSVELTQAEYEALPSSQKLDGTIYFITDVDYLGTGDIYAGTVEPSVVTPGSIYLQYNETNSTIIALWGKINDTWMKLQGGSSGGGGSQIRSFSISENFGSTHTTSAYETPTE